MEEHTMGQLLLNVSDFYGQLGAQILAVHFNHSWVRVCVAPDFQLVYKEMELSSGLKVKGFVLLNSSNWESQKIWPSWYVPLEFHQNWPPCFCMVVDVRDRNHYFFIVMSYEEWSNQSVVCPCYSEWGPIWENQI